MNSRQRFIFQGALGADPEMRYTASGMAIASFSVATDRSYKKNDEWVKETEWHRCVAFGKLAERIGEYLRKGSWVSTDDAYLKTNSWQDKNEVTRYNTNIVCNKLDFLANFGNGESEGGGGYKKSPGKKKYDKPAPNNRYQSDPSDDDIPF